MAPHARSCPFCGADSVPALTVGDRNRETTAARFTYNRCVSCETLFMLDVPADVAPYYVGDYHRFSPDGAAAWEANPTLAAVETERVAMLLEHIEPGGPLIDIGAGPGGFAAAAKNAGFEVTAIEMDERSCDYMQSRLDVRTICSDQPVTELARQPSARVISAWHVLEHLRDPAELLATAAERLQPGGVLALGVPNPQSLQFRLLGTRWAHLDAPRHLCLVPERALVTRLESLGLRPVEITTDDLFAALCRLHGWVFALRRRPATGDSATATVRAAQAVSRLVAPVERRGRSGPVLTMLFAKDDDGEAARMRVRAGELAGQTD